MGMMIFYTNVAAKLIHALIARGCCSPAPRPGDSANETRPSSRRSKGARRLETSK
jgi:hypothetical protein